MGSASRGDAGDDDQRAATAEISGMWPDDIVVDWMRSKAIPLAGVEPRQGFAELEPLRTMFGDARIVSLGEATHGTREFFKLKHRLLEFCVAELGVTMFGIEASFPESLVVNAYVLGGDGNAADALAGMRYWLWDTEEVLDLVEWIRWWNAKSERKVKFYGFVAAFPTVAALGLIDFLVCVAPQLAAECAACLAPLTSDFTADLFGQLSSRRRETVLACIAQVLAAFEDQRTQWIANTSAIDWHLGRLHANVLDQSARFTVEGVSADHDRAMAENVVALMDAEGPDTKAVLWSHNNHAARVVNSRGGRSMGKYLDEMVGAAQVVVGFSFGGGSFQARSYPTGTVAEHKVTAPVPNSFDCCLARMELPLFALDLVDSPREGSVGAWLASEMPMRSIGGVYGLPADNLYDVSYTVPITPREHFDVVVFVAETTAARPNHGRSMAFPSIVRAIPTNLELSGDVVPVGWQMPGAHRRHAHAILVSKEPSPRGGRTVCLSRGPGLWRWGDGKLVQSISARAWRGRRLRFSAAVRTMTESVGAGALLFVTFLPTPDRGESDFPVAALSTLASAGQPTRSPQWGTLTVDADVPEAADSFVIGLVMTGDGAAWFGDLELVTTS